MFFLTVIMKLIHICDNLKIGREWLVMNKSIPEITLNDGVTLPVIGFGTYPLKGNAGVNAIQSAIDVGYRLIDSAYNYENEGTVGEAVRRSSVPR